jgi:DNA polymerase V
MARDYDGSNTTGFVSPASDSLESPIDLSEILDLRRPHRYPVRVGGDALIERGSQRRIPRLPTVGRARLGRARGRVSP